MPFAVNPDDGTKIHYEVEGSGPPLVLIHGLAWDLSRWNEYGYLPQLAADHRVVMYELRAHGQSESPIGAESYAPGRHAGDVIAVLDDLGMRKAHFFGYSLAALIGLAVLRHAPERMSSLTLGGIPQLDSPIVDAMIQSRQSGPDSALAEMEKFRGYQESKTDRDRYLSQAFEVQTTLLTTLRDRTELFEHLESTSLPVMAYAGTEDPFHDHVADTAALIPGARFVPLDCLTHPLAVRRADKVLPHVTNFLAEVESAR